MEILVEIVMALLAPAVETVIVIIFEFLGEVGLRTLGEPFRRDRPVNPFFAVIGYAIFGAVAGWISLLIFPTLFLTGHLHREINVIVTPFLAGLVMCGVGAWRRKRDEELIRLDRFGYGYVFALAMAVVRYLGGQ